LPELKPCHSLPQATRGIKNGNTFATLHPEEEQWVVSRNAITRPKIVDYVTTHLSAGALPASTADQNLKIAIVNSGGGKRAFFNSIGPSY